MDKRGSHQLVMEELWTLPRVIMVVMVLAVIVLIVSSYVSRDVETYDLETSVIMNRLLYSEDCLAYFDERVYPGVVDIGNINENRIGGCVDYGKNKGVKIELFDSQENIIADALVNTDFLKTNLNKCSAKEHKSVDCGFMNQYVLIKDNNGIKNGFLQISMVRLN